ncbi:hypothetical protein AAF712_013599 [Marasmius tenuissimus]|uniref:F-box domain-containing protein n=1 Tax=Marasmius tenuissimus TaxID=585030 RepID=A0ABR2ZF65_9AGAR
MIMPHKSKPKMRKPRLKFDGRSPQIYRSRLDRICQKINFRFPPNSKRFNALVPNPDLWRRLLDLAPEIFYEIMSWLPPKDLLALAASSSQLREFLTHPDADYPWRVSRLNHVAKEPIPGMTDRELICFLHVEPCCEVQQARFEDGLFSLHLVLYFLPVHPQKVALLSSFWNHSDSFPKSSFPRRKFRDKFPGLDQDILEFLVPMIKMVHKGPLGRREEQHYLLEDVKMVQYETQRLEGDAMKEYMRTKTEEVSAMVDLVNMYTRLIKSEHGKK